jgi:hypothetical protein
MMKLRELEECGKCSEEPLCTYRRNGSFVNIANNRKMERRGCSFGELPGNIHSNRHRQIGAATEKIV